jgi:integrase
MQGGGSRERLLTVSVRRDPDGRWRYRRVVNLKDGTQVRISGTAPKFENNKAAAETAEREHIHRALHPEIVTPKKEVPTYEEWFDGRFWKEWVIGERNKPSERIAKKGIFKIHLKPAFGPLRLDEIGVEQIQQLRAKMVEAKLGDKRINNVMAVLSKSLRYAAEVELIERAPKIRLRKIDRSEIDPWSFEDYARLLVAAKAESSWWYVGACLAGEAGLRIGEIRALKWREDVDLAGGTITVSRQAGNGHEGTPKGRTCRTVPLSATMIDALKALDVVRTGYVVRNTDGTPMRDAQTSHAIYRVCRRAALPEVGWHTLRHTFGTHAARFGVNPWQLMEWMGHKRIDETMGYVHIAERYRSIPPELVAAGMKEIDPTDRVLAMLSARAKFLPNSAGTTIASSAKSSG